MSESRNPNCSVSSSSSMQRLSSKVSSVPGSSTSRMWTHQSLGQSLAGWPTKQVRCVPLTFAFPSPFLHSCPCLCPVPCPCLCSFWDNKVDVIGLYLSSRRSASPLFGSGVDLLPDRFRFALFLTCIVRWFGHFSERQTDRRLAATDRIHHPA